MLIFITDNFAIVAIYRTNPIKESSLPICHRCKVRIRTYTIERKIKNWREMKIRERERIVIQKEAIKSFIQASGKIFGIQIE